LIELSPGLLGLIEALTLLGFSASFNLKLEPECLNKPDLEQVSVLKEKKVFSLAKDKSPVDLKKVDTSFYLRILFK
jgi:hypothetical protein